MDELTHKSPCRYCGGEKCFNYDMKQDKARRIALETFQAALRASAPSATDGFTHGPIPNYRDHLKAAQDLVEAL